MAERRCGICREPGHTRTTCPTVYAATDTWAGKVTVQFEQSPAYHGQAAADLFDAPTQTDRPKVYASFYSECDECDGAIFEGDEIVRKDGSWVCASHVEQSEPDAFSEPGEPAEPDRKKTDRNGYRVKDPRTGDFRRWKKGTVRSFTRATTFIKAASDRTQLTAWNERNVLIGAARNPGVAARALAWNADTTEGKRELDSLVGDLSEKAGSKEAADKGTAIHASIEKWIAGAGSPREEIPEEHRPYVQAYSQALNAHELRVVTSMVERTVFYPLPDDAGIVGTFDQVVQHVPTGRYYMADLKTGARMDYAWQEYEAQAAIYRDGYDTFGTYFWGATEDDDRWERPELRLDEHEAIIFHIPAKHEGREPYCDLLRANLDEGREHLRLCHTVREQIALRPKPTRWETPQFHAEPDRSTGERWTKGVDGLWSRTGLPVEPEERDWEAEFGQATSKLHLAGLYESARSVIDDEVRLRALIDVGMARLAELEKEPPF